MGSAGLKLLTCPATCSSRQKLLIRPAIAWARAKFHMINRDLLPQALKALQRLIIHSKAQAYRTADHNLAELLNDMELLPEFLADGPDRTEEFVEMLQGI